MKQGYSSKSESFTVDDDAEKVNSTTTTPTTTTTTNMSPQPRTTIARGIKHRRMGSRPTMPIYRDDQELLTPLPLPPLLQSPRPLKKRAFTKERFIEFVVRPMRMSDLATVFHLGNNIFTASEFPNLYRTWDDFAVIENYHGSPEFCFVAVAQEEKTTTTTMTMDSNEIVGFLLGSTMEKANVETRGYIEWVAVSPTHRRAGIATQMIQAFSDVASQTSVSLLLADTQSDNAPAIQLLKKAGLTSTTDHVYMTRQIQKDHEVEHVCEDGSVNFCYTVHKKRITIRKMHIDDLYPIYAIGEQIFTKKNQNLFNFWDEHLVLQSYMSDPDLCVVATVKEEDGEKVVGFCFGTTIEKPRSSWKYGYLVWLGCSTEYQGLGLASQLYHVIVELFVLEKCRILMIDTQLNNEGALRFFRKKGFGHDEEHVYLSNSTD